MRSPRERRNGTPRSLAALTANPYWRANEAERVLAAWRRSGQSAAAFARDHGLKAARLLRWRVRLERHATPAFHPVRVVEREDRNAITASEPLELVLRGGRCVRVTVGFDPELLETLVRTVEGW